MPYVVNDLTLFNQCITGCVRWQIGGDLSAINFVGVLVLQSVRPVGHLVHSLETDYWQQHLVVIHSPGAANPCVDNPKLAWENETMSDTNKNDNVVLAFFADEATAKDAIDGLKLWDRANDHIKLGAIGTISKEGDKVKTSVGRKVGKGMAIGAAVGVIGAAVATGGASLIAGAIGAGALGGVLGAFFKRSMNLTQDEIAAIGKELDAGRVAVVVTCDDYEIPLVSEYMTGSGGAVRTYKVPAEALAEAAKAPEVMDAVSEG